MAWKIYVWCRNDFRIFMIIVSIFDILWYNFDMIMFELIDQ